MNPLTDSRWTVAGVELGSRLLLGTALYPSLQTLGDAVQASGTEVLTVSLRRLQPEHGGGNTFWQRISAMGKHILPNTAGCHSAQEAITLAHMAREIFNTAWIKLEVVGDEHTLQPDLFDVSLNGRPVATAAPTLRQLLEQQGYDLAAAMACAINKQFVPRPQWHERGLKAGDQIDVITPITGG